MYHAHTDNIIANPIILSNQAESTPKSQLMHIVLTYKDVYFGGFEDLVIEWMPEGVYYKIDEYDGYESIVTVDTVDWSIA